MELSKLASKFKPKDLEWRVQSSGENNGKVWCKVLVYVNNRAIMERLDSVCGVGGWKNEYMAGPSGGVLCGISIKIDGEWVTKWDGAENTNIDPVKGGLSNSMKRAGSQWGIGRYLYNFPSQMYAEVSNTGKEWGKTKQGTSFHWNPPAVPSWALPEPEKATKTQLKTLENLAVNMDVDESASMRVFYCNKKCIPVCMYEDMPTDMIQNLIDKFDTVYNSWKNVVEK